MKARTARSHKKRTARRARRRALAQVSDNAGGRNLGSAGYYCCNAQSNPRWLRERV